VDPIIIVVVMLCAALLGAVRLRLTVFSEKQRKSKAWFIICLVGLFLVELIAYLIILYLKEK